MQPGVWNLNLGSPVGLWTYQVGFDGVNAGGYYGSRYLLGVDSSGYVSKWDTSLNTMTAEVQLDLPAGQVPSEVFVTNRGLLVHCDFNGNGYDSLQLFANDTPYTYIDELPGTVLSGDSFQQLTATNNAVFFIQNVNGILYLWRYSY